MPKTFSTYRYSKRKWIDLLLEEGSMQIGTLYDFRKEEKHAKGILDKDEGSKNVALALEKFELSDEGAKHHKQANIDGLKALNIFSEPPPGRSWNETGIRFENMSVGRQIFSQDLFILCSSSVCSNETMRQFDGADTCIGINNLYKFFACITKNLCEQRKVQWNGFHQISYGSRMEAWDANDSGKDPALIKESIFRPQHEWRAVWQPLEDGFIEPLLIKDLRLRNFCTLVEPKV